MNQPTSRTPDPAALLRQALDGAEATSPWPAPAIADLAAVFPELSVHDRIGQGGMAAVYHATQSRLGRSVALKVMRPELASEPSFAQRFVREAKALATLSNPHVLTIHDFGERAGFCYLVTEYVDGANLRELMQLGRLSPDEVLRIVPQICAGLHFAHQHGVVHRDIKPENVLVDRHGQVKLVDFGLAKLAGAPGPALTRSSSVMGTPQYMAPEQWHGSAGVDHRADIYSLGVVLYELLTGKLPVGTYAPASAQPGVPAGIDQVVQRSLQQEPELRYQSAHEVQRDLELQRGAAASAATTILAADVAPGAFSAVRLLVAGALVPLLGLPLLAVFLERESRLASDRVGVEFADLADVHLAGQVVDVVAAGRPWLGALPEPDQRLAGYELLHQLPMVLGVVAALVVVAATMLLGSAAWLRTRHLGASRLQQLLAGVLYLLPPVGGLCLAICAVADRAQREWLLGVVGLLIGVGSLALLRRLWGLTARRRPGAPPALGAGHRRALWCTGLVGIGVVVLAWFGPRHAPRAPRLQVPVTGERLIGRSRTEVLDTLGPPVAITIAQQAGTWMAWSYRGLDGVERAEALQFDGGVVTRSQQPGTLLVPTPRPANGAHAGMTVGELVQVLGPASETLASTTGMLLVFADGSRAAVSPDGIVQHVGR